MRRLTADLFLLMALALAPALVPGARSASAATARYVVVPGSGTEVVFESHAPMETFTGHTDQVTGWLEADLDDLTVPLDLEVTVDLASFDTGIGKRNDHMRDNHFETATYPVAIFRGGLLAADSPAAVPIGGSTELQLTGTLDLHGVAREMTCTVTVDRQDAATLAVRAEFGILLPDHAIERPKFLFLKLAEDQEVKVDLVLQREGG